MSSSSASCPCPPADWRKESPHPADAAGAVRAGGTDDEPECPCAICVVKKDGVITEVKVGKSGGQFLVRDCPSSSSSRLGGSSLSRSSISVPSLGSSSSSRSRIPYQCCPGVTTHLAGRLYLTILEVGVFGLGGGCIDTFPRGTYPLDYVGTYPRLTDTAAPGLYPTWEYRGYMAGAPTVPFPIAAQVYCTPQNHGGQDAPCQAAQDPNDVHKIGPGNLAMFWATNLAAEPTWPYALNPSPAPWERMPCLYGWPETYRNSSQNIVCCGDAPPVFSRLDAMAVPTFRMKVIVNPPNPELCCHTHLNPFDYAISVAPLWICSE